MQKRHYGIFLIIAIIFLVIPYSFAVDNNLTENNAVLEDISDDSLLENDDLLTDIHVDLKGSDDNDGSEANPVATISKALNISSNHSTIVIHEGIYKENNLNITKSLDIISQGNVVIDAENSSRIFTINTVTSSDKVLLSGITFINARAYQGGAIYVRNAQTTIENSKFINNTAMTEGGSIYWNAPYGKVINTLFYDNSARDGAAVSWGGVNASEDLFGVKSDYGEIINCTFENNHLMQDDDACVGLSVYADYVKIINSTFKNHNVIYNSSFEVLYSNGDNSQIIGCLFINNSMTMAGALGLDGNFAEAYGNTFINNSMSFDDSFGGAIGIQSENANIYNNTFINNGGLTGVGGAIFINTIETFSFNFIDITDNLFIDNYAQLGGGIYTTGKSNMLSLNIINNTFNGGNAVNAAGIYLSDIYNPVIIQGNVFKNLNASDSVCIYSTHCILDLSNNLIENCTSKSDDLIFTDGELKSKTYLKFNDVIGVAGKPTTLTAKMFDDMNNTISSNAITFTINGVKLSGKKEINKLTYEFRSTGKYIIGGSYNCENITVENGTLTVRNGAILYVSDITNYGKNVDVKVRLTTDDSTTIANDNVILHLDGSSYLLITDNNGEAKNTLKLDYGIYNLTFELAGDNYYQTVASSTLTVLPSINAIDMTRAYKSEYDFIANMVNKDGSPLKNTEVIFKINNEEYKVLTDSDGNAKLTENLETGTYIVNVENPITGESVSKNLKIVKRLTENSNINMYFGAGKEYKVLVYDDEGNIAKAGEKVSFKINGKTYTRKTDENGYASYKITQAAKTYTITATYKGVNVSNKVVIKPVLTAKDISKKKAKTIKFTAKLVDTKGKVLKNKKITFKFKGKTYTSKTNKKGIVTLSLKNLKVGKYSITTKYGKSTIKNTIKIKK